MPRPKKADKQRKEDVVPDLRQDREEFLRKFEKPTQIYRFLRARHFISPTFLHRTLLYMLKRNSRTHARRQKFAVNDMLETCLWKQSADKVQSAKQYDQLKILVLGFCIDPGVGSENNVGRKFSSLETQVSLRKTHRSRRKDGDSTQSEELIGLTDTPINPRNVDAYEEDPLYLSTTDIHQASDGGPSVKNYTLMFRVYESGDGDSESESEYSDSDNSESWSDTPGSRKRKRKEDDPAGISLKNLTTGTRRRRTINEDDKQDENEDGEPETRSAAKKHKRNHDEKSCKPSNNAIYEAELVMFNSEKELLLKTGEYELSLTRTKNETHGRRRNATWEALDGGRDIELLSTMNSAPVLKFKLQWSENEKPGPLSGTENGEARNGISDEPETKRMRRRQSAKSNSAAGDGGVDSDKPPARAVDTVEYRKAKLRPQNRPKPVRDDDEGANGDDKFLVCYQFIYNSETQQQTEAREDLFCPWCQLNCMTLYGLIKHLKLCHPRFNFAYVPQQQQQQSACVEVSVNECYDGSYCGNPQFIFAQPGMAFSRRGPVHRIEVTDTLVYRPRRERRYTSLDLAELLEKEENEASPTAHYTAGHHRLYFHSRNAVPIRPCEFDADSEDEADPDWLRAYTKRMLDEFTDVNEGEKPVMKLWNLYIMKNCCIADAQLLSSCETFLDLYGPLIARHALRNNLLLHFVTLIDFGVLKASALISLMERFDRLAATVTPVRPDVKQEPKMEAGEPQQGPAQPTTPEPKSLAGPKAKRVSVGDTTMGSKQFYEHNMSCQIDRLHAIISSAETKTE